MFPNSPERDELKHSLGRVLHHSVVRHGSPVVFGSDNILPLAGFVLTHGVSCWQQHPQAAPVPPPPDRDNPHGPATVPPFRLQPPNSGAAARKRFPDVRHELPDNRSRKPHQPSPAKAPAASSAPQAHPRQVSPCAVPARWDTGARSISNTQIPEWRDGNGTITCSNSCAVTHATAGTR